MVLTGAFSWAIGTVLMKKYPISLPTTVLTASQLLLGGISIAVGATVFENPHENLIGIAGYASLLYNTLVAMIVCHWAWFKIVSKSPAGLAALSTLLIPVVGVCSGVIILGERISWIDMAALASIILAIISILSVKKKNKSNR